MRSLTAFTLITLWLFCVVSGRAFGGFVHLLAVLAVVVVFTSADRPTRFPFRR